MDIPILHREKHQPAKLFSYKKCRYSLPNNLPPRDKPQKNLSNRHTHNLSSKELEVTNTFLGKRGNIRSLLKCLSRWLLPWLAQFYNCGPPRHSLTPILVVFLHSIFHHLNVVFYSHMLSVTCFSPIRFIIQLRQDFQDFLTSEFSESTVGILGWCHTHMVEVPSPGASVKKTLQTFLLCLARPSWQRPWGSC